MTAVSEVAAPASDSTIVAPLADETVRGDEFFLGRLAGDVPVSRDREWWRRQAKQHGFDLHAVIELCLEIIGSRLFESTFTRACRIEDERRNPARPRKPMPRPTPAAVVEAVLHTVGERGVGALKVASNVERLRRCDAAARTEINRRIAKMGAGNA